ncbi:MAG: serine/threonine protein kinase, partial [Myxococcales bacterium]|nr:serine/threonine protein kinase [Myxococcales bacterium]
MPTAGPYQLTHLLGEGAMGRVWAARGPDARPLAVKCLRAGDVDRSTLDRELALLARLDHPNVAAILDHGVLTVEDEAPVELIGRPWIAVERLDADLVARPPATWSELRTVLTGVAEGLAHAHARGVLHLDLKPANVMLAGSTPRIVDFGVAELVGAGVAGRVRGSPGFMSPEQLSGHPPTVSDDLFGLGALGWSMVSGAGPYESPSIAAIRAAAVGGEAHPLPAWVPTDLASLLGALVAPDPASRPAFAADVVAALRAMDWPVGALPEVGPSVVPAALTLDLWADDP